MAGPPGSHDGAHRQSSHDLRPSDGGRLGHVIESDHKDFPVNSIVVAPFLGYPWQTNCVLNAADSQLNLRLATLKHRPTLDLGTLGLPGATSWFCMLKAGKPKPNDTVVISGAAGACGSLAGQLAKKVAGSKNVVGICGTDEKCQLLTTYLGFDHAVNYNSRTFHEDLINATKNQGIDVYMDNVGGDVSESVLTMVNENARVPICGQISEYDNDIKYSDLISEMGVQSASTRKLLKDKNVNRFRFLVLDYAHDFEKAAQELAALVIHNIILVPETVDIGFDVGNAFCDMMTGGNVGKALVLVHPDYNIGGSHWVAEGTKEMIIKVKDSNNNVSRVWRW